MKAMILAAGRGERMRPLTDSTPKPLISVAGKTLLQYHIDALVASGIQSIVVNHAWLGQQIKSYIESGQPFGCPIFCSDEGATGLETAGGIKHALPLLGDDPFCVVNGDIWTDYPFARLQLPAGKLAHLVLVPNPPHHPEGDFAVAENGDALLSGHQCFTYSGIGIYHPSFFDPVPTGSAKLAPYLKQAMQQQLISAEVYRGHWYDIGTIERLNNLKALLESDDVG